MPLEKDGLTGKIVLIENGRKVRDATVAETRKFVREESRRTGRPIETVGSFSVIDRIKRSFSNDEAGFLQRMIDTGKIQGAQPSKLGGWNVLRNDGTVGKVDPSPTGFKSFLRDLPGDIADIAGEILPAGGGALGAAAGTPFGVAGEVIGGGIGGGTGEAIRQEIGKRLGVSTETDQPRIAQSALLEGLGVPIGRGTARGVNAAIEGAGNLELQLGQLAAAIPDVPGRGIEGGVDVLARRADAVNGLFGDGRIGGALTRAGDTLTGGKAPNILNPRVGTFTEFPSVQEAADRIGEVVDGLTNQRLIPEAFEVDRIVRGRMASAGPGNPAPIVNMNATMKHLRLGNFQDETLRGRADSLTREIAADILESRGQPRELVKNMDEAELTALFRRVPADSAIQIRRKIDRVAFKKNELGVRINDAMTAGARRARHQLRRDIVNQFGGPNSQFAKALGKVAEKERILQNLTDDFAGSTPKATAKAVRATRKLLSEESADLMRDIRRLDELFPGTNLEKNVRDSISGSFFEGPGGTPTLRPKITATGEVLGLAPISRMAMQAGVVGSAFGSGVPGLGPLAILAMTQKGIVRNANLQRNLLGPVIQAGPRSVESVLQPGLTGSNLAGRLALETGGEPGAEAAVNLIEQLLQSRRQPRDLGETP